MSPEGIAAISAGAVAVLGALVTGVIRIVQEWRKGIARVEDSKGLRADVRELVECTKELHSDLRAVFHVPVVRRDETPRIGIMAKARKGDGER